MARYVKDFLPFNTIRVATCVILVPLNEKRCAKCTEYRRTLAVMLHRHSKGTDGTKPTSRTNYRLIIHII